MKTNYKEVASLYGTGYPVGEDMGGVQNTVNVMFDELKLLYKDKVKPQFVFVCRGSSGAILAGCVAFMFKNDEIRCRVIHIKKPGENSHQEFVSFSKDETIIMIDDFISSGTTVNAIHNALIDCNRPFEIDTLIVGGSFQPNRLDFKPNNIICKELCISLSDVEKFNKIS